MEFVKQHRTISLIVGILVLVFLVNAFWFGVLAGGSGSAGLK